MLDMQKMLDRFAKLRKDHSGLQKCGYVVERCVGDASLDERWNDATRRFRSGDRAGALDAFKALAADGDDVALVEIGNLYELGGKGVPRDFFEAAKWYRQAVFKLDDSKAHLALARMYYSGDLESAESPHPFERHARAAAVKGETVASLMLGIAFESGYLVRRDLQAAEQHYVTAADGGMVVAKRQLAGLAFKKGHLLKALGLFLAALRDAASISSRDSNDKRLTGIRDTERGR